MVLGTDCILGTTLEILCSFTDDATNLTPFEITIAEYPATGGLGQRRP